MLDITRKYLRLFFKEEPSKYFTNSELLFIKYTLTHTEEVANLDRDQWGNWEPEFTKTDYSTPFLDKFVLDRLLIYDLVPKTIWPNQEPFALCLSHDVDRTESYSPKVFKRNIEKRMTLATFREKQLMKWQWVKNHLKQYTLSKKDDPIWHYEKWLQIEDKYGYNSTYFFFIRPSSEYLSLYDCDYIVDDSLKFKGAKMSVQEYIKALKMNNNEIGIHGSYKTFDNSVLLKDQKSVLEKIIEAPIYASRQHYLHFDIQITPNILRNSGLFQDSTLGFNTANGFRAGTAFPYFLNTNPNEETNLLEIPMIIMDVSLYASGILDGGIDNAINEIMTKMDHVQQVGGCFTVNFHPEYLNDENLWNLYEIILQEAKHRNAYNSSMANIHNIVNTICAE